MHWGRSRGDSCSWTMCMQPSHEHAVFLPGWSSRARSRHAQVLWATEHAAVICNRWVGLNLVIRLFSSICNATQSQL
jgi:hypothetical protein